MGDNLKSPFQYVLLIGKLLVVESRPKERSSFSHTSLFSVRECGRQPKIAIFVWTSYGEVVRSRVETEMAIELSNTRLYSVCECERQLKVNISVKTSYGEVFVSLAKTKMAVELFPYMPTQHM